MTSVAERVRPGTWTLDLQGTSTRMVAEMRTWARRHLVGLERAHLADVLLVATELLANAYEHGDGPRHVQLWRGVTPCGVRIEVADHNGRQPTVGDSRFGDSHGRGVLLVDRLAAAWGVRRRAGHRNKTVWAHIACDRHTSLGVSG